MDLPKYRRVEGRVHAYPARASSSTVPKAAAGQVLDLGELRGQGVTMVPKDKRGQLGMELDVATWAGTAAGLTQDEVVDVVDGLVAKSLLQLDTSAHPPRT